MQTVSCQSMSVRLISGTNKIEYKCGSILTMPNLKDQRICTHIAQNITETYQKYFQYFIAIEIFSQHFRQILQDILSQN